MKYRILEKDIINYQAERALAVLTANSSRGISLSEEELSIELGLTKDTVTKVLAQLKRENKIEEIADIADLSPHS